MRPHCSQRSSPLPAGAHLSPRPHVEHMRGRAGGSPAGRARASAPCGRTKRSHSRRTRPLHRRLLGGSPLARVGVGVGVGVRTESSSRRRRSPNRPQSRSRRRSPYVSSSSLPSSLSSSPSSTSPVFGRSTTTVPLDVYARL
jgi:hypothetical protein